jgi:hypothetical protein
MDRRCRRQTAADSDPSRRNSPFVLLRDSPSTDQTDSALTERDHTAVDVID